MRFVINVFRHVATPLVIDLAVLAGLLAAFVSALIEYYVLQQWLRVDDSRLFFLPLIIVFALEFTKLFLHFSGAAIHQNSITGEDLSAVSIFRDFTPIIKWGLVVFSFLCTLIFSANAFYYKTSSGEPPELAAAKTEIEEEYSERLSLETEKANEAYDQALAPLREEVEGREKRYNEIDIVYSPLYMYQRTKAEKEAAWEKLTDAQDQLRKAEETANMIREEAVEAAETELGLWRDQEMETLEKSTLSAVAGDNAYLSNFLLFFSQTFFDQTYSRGAYLAWVLLIALSISALLEGVISLSQYVLSFPPSMLERFSSSIEITERERRRLGRLVQILTMMLICMAVFLIYGATRELIYTKLDIGAAAISTLVTLLVPCAFAAASQSEKESRWKQTIKSALAEVRSTIIKGLLSFGGFVLIGILFGETFATLSMPAIGISIGNAVGHLLSLAPRKGESAETVRYISA